VRHLVFGEVLDRVAGDLDPMAALLDPTATASQVAHPAPEVLPERRPRARPVVIGAGRRPWAESVRLSAGLAGPVEVARAGAGPGFPAAGTARAPPGGSRYVLKRDGFPC
jgi:hypothetical protein